MFIVYKQTLHYMCKNIKLKLDIKKDTHSSFFSIYSRVFINTTQI